jgi:hypothetical protein
MLQLVRFDLFCEGVKTVEEGGCCHDGNYYCNGSGGGSVMAALCVAGGAVELFDGT